MHQLPQDHHFGNKNIRWVFQIQQRINFQHDLREVLLLPSILLVLNIIDAVSTNYGVLHGLQEINPLFSNAVIPAKFLGCAILFATSFLVNRLSPKVKILNNAILFCAVIFYVFVIVNNAFLIIQIT